MPGTPLTIEVNLLSGRRVSLDAATDESVDTLTRRAQKTLGVGRGRLLHSKGGVMDGAATLEEFRLHSGDALTLQMSTTQVRGNLHAFAAILGDGSVVTWGDAEKGGDSSAVQDRLKDVQQIQRTGEAFAAIPGRWVCRDLGPCCKWWRQ